MKLSTAQIAEVKEQTGIDPVPEEHPTTPNLKEAFGDHTFFLDTNGLHVLEAAQEEKVEEDKQALAVIRVASWTDENRTALAPHEPQVSEAALAVTAEEGDGDSSGGDGAAGAPDESDETKQ